MLLLRVVHPAGSLELEPRQGYPQKPTTFHLAPTHELRLLLVLTPLCPHDALLSWQPGLQGAHVAKCGDDEHHNQQDFQNSLGRYPTIFPPAHRSCSAAKLVILGRPLMNLLFLELLPDFPATLRSFLDHMGLGLRLLLSFPDASLLFVKLNNS